MEGAELGAFMVSACVFGVVLGHPESALVAWLPDAFARRVLMGIAMGVHCAKLQHHNARRCIFRCDAAALRERRRG